MSGKNVNRRLGDRVWDAQGVEWTKRRSRSGYHLPPDEVRALVVEDGLLLGHSPVRWLDGSDAALAVRDPVTGEGLFCANPLGGSLWDEAGGRRRLVILEEVH